MNTYLYRCNVTGAAPCGTAPSRIGMLTVNPLPVIIISATAYQKLWPGLFTRLISTVSPIAASYIWFRNGGIVATGTANITTPIPPYTVDVDGLGTYQLKVTDVNGCTNVSNSVVISDSLSPRVFIYPNPSSGIFQVRYNPTSNNALPRGLNVYNTMGQRILINKYPLGVPYANMGIDLRNFGSGIYTVEVVDVNGNRLAVGRAQVLR